MKRQPGGRRRPYEGVYLLAFGPQAHFAPLIRDAKGALIDEPALPDQIAGENTINKNISRLLKGNIYFITLETPGEIFTQKVIFER